MVFVFVSFREFMLVLLFVLLIIECNEVFIWLIEVFVKDVCLGLNFNEFLSVKRVE